MLSCSVLCLKKIQTNLKKKKRGPIIISTKKKLQVLLGNKGAFYLISRLPKSASNPEFHSSRWNVTIIPVIIKFPRSVCACPTWCFAHNFSWLHPAMWRATSPLLGGISAHYARPLGKQWRLTSQTQQCNPSGWARPDRGWIARNYSRRDLLRRRVSRVSVALLCERWQNRHKFSQPAHFRLSVDHAWEASRLTWHYWPIPLVASK